MKEKKITIKRKVFKIGKEVKHRHKWNQCFSDCPRCGSEMYFECGCGEVRLDIDAEKIFNRLSK